LQAPHHFDALIEKPPTTSKLTEVMCRLCQWKAPSPGTSYLSAYPQPSGLRQESLRFEDSPTSGSSGYAHMPGSSFRGSSREDSITSSIFGDSESTLNDDVPVVIGRKATGEWDEAGGLGISGDISMVDVGDLPKSPPHLLTESTAPGRMEHAQKILLRQRSSEKMKAKRESMEKHRRESGESGDDEDEELGDAAVREKSPRSSKSTQRGSKLGTEMMRTNSRGSIVSGTEPSSADVELPPTVPEEIPAASEISGQNLTPPEIFSTPGGKISTIDLNQTPKAVAPLSDDMMDEEPTPRPPSVASNAPDYISVGTKDHR